MTCIVCTRRPSGLHIYAECMGRSIYDVGTWTPGVRNVCREITRCIDKGTGIPGFPRWSGYNNEIAEDLPDLGGILEGGGSGLLIDDLALRCFILGQCSVVWVIGLRLVVSACATATRAQPS